MMTTKRSKCQMLVRAKPTDCRSEEIQRFCLEENDEGEGGDGFDDVSKSKADQMKKDLESNSDDDDLDDSDESEKETSEAASANTRPNPAEQILTGASWSSSSFDLRNSTFDFVEKGHKKARDEEMRDIKSQVISLSKISATPSNPA